MFVRTCNLLDRNIYIQDIDDMCSRFPNLVGPTHFYISVSEHVLDVAQQQNIVFQSKQLEGAFPTPNSEPWPVYLYIYIYIYI